MTVLICDDNRAVHESLTAYLTAAGIRSISLYNGNTLLSTLEKEDVDLVLLDIMLPGRFGTELCREIRRHSNVPIIFLSAKSEEEDRILGLQIGADDYVTKPFSPREVIARIFTVLKRSNPSHSVSTQLFSNLTLDVNAYRAYVDQQLLDLTPKEFQVLKLLIASSEKVLSRDYILDFVWGYEYYGDTRAVDTIIKRLRKKLAAAGAQCTIRAVYGVGYQLEVANADA